MYIYFSKMWIWCSGTTPLLSPWWMVDMFFVFFFSRVAHDIQMRYIDIFSMKKLSFTRIKPWTPKTGQQKYLSDIHGVSFSRQMTRLKKTSSELVIFRHCGFKFPLATVVYLLITSLLISYFPDPQGLCF